MCVCCKRDLHQCVPRPQIPADTLGIMGNESAAIGWRKGEELHVLDLIHIHTDLFGSAHCHSPCAPRCPAGGQYLEIFNAECDF